METDKLNKRIQAKAKEELAAIVDEFIAKLDSVANRKNYVTYKPSEHERFGISNDFPIHLKRIVELMYLDSLHNKKIEKVLKQFEI
jgi:hypothetical protein